MYFSKIKSTNGGCLGKKNRLKLNAFRGEVKIEKGLYVLALLGEALMKLQNRSSCDDPLHLLIYQNCLCQGLF